MGNFVESFVPGDAFKNLAGGGARATRAFGFYASHRIENAVGGVNTIQILSDFGAEESAGDGVFGITLDPGGATALDGNQHAAGVWAIVRAGGVDDALHPQIIVETLLAPFSGSRKESRLAASLQLVL